MEERGLEALIDVRTADAAGFDLEPDSYDVAMAIGTCFIWGHIGDAARALVPSVKRGGYLALGEPYWRSAAATGGRAASRSRACRRRLHASSPPACA